MSVVDADSPVDADPEVDVEGDSENVDVKWKDEDPSEILDSDVENVEDEDAPLVVDFNSDGNPSEEKDGIDMLSPVKPLRSVGLSSWSSTLSKFMSSDLLSEIESNQNEYSEKGSQRPSSE